MDGELVAAATTAASELNLYVRGGEIRMITEAVLRVAIEACAAEIIADKTLDFQTRKYVALKLRELLKP